ncbi:uncharacterized protein LOC128496789 [Spea bombifrons]|uniref:uncharacterized protein LOC128496789 n=1 Tax=Spea bombifrons TaxID=233779 RepID=UPI00234967E5|nr:uncharacterized protein LOC128496789 [Spea bombifrons]
MQTAERSGGSPVGFAAASGSLAERSHGDGQYLCIECNETFDDKLRLSAHRQSHVAKKPFTCSHCGRGFHHHVFLQMHERSHEDGVPGTKLSGSLPAPSSARGMSTRSSKAAGPSQDKTHEEPRPPKPELPVNSKVEFKQEKPRCQAAAPVECVTRLTRGKAPPACKATDATETRSQFDFRVSTFSDTRVRLIDAFGNSVELLTEVFSSYASAREGESGEIKTTKMDSGHGARESHISTRPSAGAASPGLRRGDGVPGKSRRSTSRSYQNLRSESARAAQPSGHFPVSGSPAAGHVSSGKQFESSSSLSASQASSEGTCGSKQRVSKVSDVEIPPPGGGDLKPSVVGHKDFPEDVGVQPRAGEMLREAGQMNSSEVTKVAGIPHGGPSMSGPTLQNSVGDTTPATQESRTAAANEKPKNIAADIAAERGLRESDVHEGMSLHRPDRVSSGDRNESIAKEREQLTEAASDLMPTDKAPAASGNGEKNGGESRPEGGDPEKVSLVTGVSDGDVKLSKPDSSDGMLLGGNKDQAANVVVTESPAEPGKPRASDTGGAGSQCHANSSSQSTEGTRNPQAARTSDSDTFLPAGDQRDRGEAAEKAGERLGQNDKERGGDVGMSTDISLADRPAQPDGAECAGSMNPSLTPERDSGDNLPSPKPEGDDCSDSRAPVPPSESNETVPGDINSEASSNKPIVERDEAAVTREKTRDAQPAGHPAHEENILPSESGGEPVRADDDIKSDEPGKAVGFTQPGGIMYKDPAFPEKDSQLDGRGHNLTVSRSDDYGTVDKRATETLSPPIALSAEGGPTESALSGEPNSLATEQVAADTPKSVMMVEESRDVQTIDLDEGKAVSDLDSSGWKQGIKTDLLDDNHPVLLKGSLDVLPHAGDDGCSAQVDATKLDVRSLESSETSDKERQLSERDLKKYLPQPLETSGDDLPTEQPVDASPVHDSEKRLLAGRNGDEPEEGDALAPSACAQRSHGEEVRRGTSHSHGVCAGHTPVGDKVNNDGDVGSAAAEDRSHLPEGGLLSERLQPQEQAVGKSQEGSHEEQAEASESTAGLATTLSSGVRCMLCKQKLRSYRGESPALLCYKCRQRRKKEARIPQTDANHLVCHIKQEPCEEGLPDGLTSDVNPHEADAETTKMYNCHKCDQSFKLPALLAGHMKNHSLARCLTCGCQMRVRYKVRRIPRRCQSCVQKIRDKKKKKKKELFAHNEAIKEEDGEKWESMNSDCELDGGRTFRPSPRSSSKVKVRKGKLPRSHLVGNEHWAGEPSPNERNQEAPVSTKVASLIRALPKLHKCPECGMSFKRPGFLIKHVRKHALLHHCTCHLLLKKTHKKCLHCREQLKGRGKGRLSSQRAPSKKTAVGSVLQYPSTSLKESAHDDDSDQLALAMAGDVGSRRPKKSKLLQKSHGKKGFTEHAMERRKPASKAPLPPGAETGNVSQDNPDLCDAAQILRWEEGTEIGPTSRDEEEADEGFVGETLLCKEDVVNDADQLGLDDKPHVCPQCGKSFQTYKSLHLHELVHTGEHCESCGCRLRLRKGGGRRSKKCRGCKLQEKGQSAEAKNAIAAKVSTLLGLQKKKKVVSSKGIKSELKKLPKGVKHILVKRLIKKPKKEKGNGMPLKKQVRRKKAKESVGDDTVTDVSDRVLSSPNSNVELEGKIFAEPAEPEALMSTTSPESDTEGTSGMSHDPLKKIKGSHKGKLLMLKDGKPEVTDNEGKALPGDQSSLLTGDKANRCLVCDQSFASPELLCTHRQSHAAELPFACTQCPQRFHKKQLLNIHIVTHVKERPHRCPDCNKCFTGLNNLNMHRRVHMGLRPYSCPDCPMSFRHKVSLLVHRYTHTKTPPVALESYRCSFCGKSFVRSDHLEDHQRVHTGDCPFRCQDCDKTFPSQARLAVHSRVHSRVVSHSCPHCERSFINKANLERHQQKHTGELAFSCTECDVRFPSLVMLARHKHSHRVAEVFSCIRCAKTFLYKSCLFKHQNVCQGVKKGSNKGQTRGIKRKKSEQAAEQGQTHKRQKGGQKIAKGVKRKKEGKPVKIKMETVQQEEGPSEEGQEEDVPKEEVKSNENRAERGKKKRAEGKPAKAADGKHDDVAAVKVKKRKLLKEGIKTKEPKEGAKAKERKTKDGLKPGEEKVKKSKVGIKRGPYKKKIQIGATGDKKKIVRVKIKGVKLKPGPKKKQGMKDKK